MNKEDNPFYTLAQHMKPSNNIQQFNIGKVISTSPLLINCNGIQLDRDDLSINKDLLKGTKRKIRINSLDEIEFENLENTFQVGSEVILFTNDNQRFHLVCEVI